MLSAPRGLHAGKSAPDPQKREAVFRKDHAQTTSSETRKAARDRQPSGLADVVPIRDRFPSSAQAPVSAILVTNRLTRLARANFQSFAARMLRRAMRVSSSW